GVYNNVKDADGFDAEARQGRQMGFDGKTLIHPSQIGPANTAFSPSDEDISSAREIIDLFEQAQSAGRGVVTYNGRMIEELHVRDARRTLAIADALAARSRYAHQPKSNNLSIWAWVSPIACNRSAARARTCAATAALLIVAVPATADVAVRAADSRWLRV